MLKLFEIVKKKKIKTKKDEEEGEEEEEEEEEEIPHRNIPEQYTSAD